eukprot:637380-Amphidinium_carterae.3
MLRRQPVLSEYIPGQLVYFWTPAKGGRRHRRVPDPGRWRGPATILAREGAKRYFISWRARLLLVAPEQLRMASQREARLHGLVEEETALQDNLHQDKTAEALDVRNAGPPSFEDEDKRGEVIVPRRILGPSRAEQQDLTDVKRKYDEGQDAMDSRPIQVVRRQVRRMRTRRTTGLMPVTDLVRLGKRRASFAEAEEAVEPPVTKQRRFSATQPEQLGENRAEESEFWKTVGLEEDEYARKDDQRLASHTQQTQGGAEKFVDDYTDVPYSLRTRTSVTGVQLCAEETQPWSHLR